jgi:hypothetical protein
MARTLVVPGVSVETRFDVPPPLPARSGILGAVGVVDRIPEGDLRSVTSTQELLELYGPATRFSFPEVVAAIVNGVSEVVVSPVDPRSGRPAELRLTDDEGEEVVILRARAAGPWGNELAVRVVRTLASDGRTIRRVSLEVLHQGRPIERHDNLIFRAGDDNDFFVTVNRDSGVIVALDPVFETDLPVADTSLVGFEDSGAQAATGQLRLGGAPLINLQAARPGAAGSRISVAVRAGRAGLVLMDSAGDPSLRVRAREAGADGTSFAVGVADDGAGGVTLEVQGAGGNVRSYPNQTAIAALVTALAADPDVIVDRLGNLLPEPTAGRVNLLPSVTVTVQEEGVRTVDFEDHTTAEALAEALDGDDALEATLVGDADALPDPGTANAFFLGGGRDAGPARRYSGQNNPDAAILELVPAPGADAGRVRFRVGPGTLSNTVRIVVGLELESGFEEREAHDNLTMDPDSPRYLPQVLREESGLLRGIDRFQRLGAAHFPASTFAPRRLQGGSAPALAAWRAAIDALAQEDAVDMVLAGLQGWRDTNLDGIAVQQALLGHARAQADNARPRIALGSIRPESNADVPAILDHAGQVADRRFVLVAPAGAEGAVAGLLGHLQYFMSPTFKTIASPGVPLHPYSDGELNRLLGPDGNVCVVLQRRGRGTICVKGIATDGFQISVVRIADRCVREVKKIADRFIGELNNDEQRGALRQMIVATFTQMERDGALVPSVDGSSPAFEVDVYASQNDAAAGIARIDIAVRPVRAIDYVYATIRVKN